MVDIDSAPRRNQGTRRNNNRSNHTETPPLHNQLSASRCVRPVPRPGLAPGE
nr:MAG TPA: hypothetical protein [Caudoviricetes sp.]